MTHSLTRIASAAVSAWRFVDITGAHATSAATAVGISEQAAAVGRAFSVVTSYSCFVEAAEAIAEGDLVKPAGDVTGRAVKGTVGDNCGRALGSAAAGRLVSVRFLEAAAGVGAGSEMAFGLSVDSRFEQGFRPPSSPLGGTTAVGSYLAAGDVKTRGVMRVFPENPARLQYRLPHGFPAKHEIIFGGLQSGHPGGGRRYRLTTTAADEVILDGVDATAWPALVSAGAATDAMTYVDMAYANWGPWTYALKKWGVRPSSMDGVMMPGGTTTQIAARFPFLPKKRYLGWLHCSGRNNTVYDEPALIAIRDWLLAYVDNIFIATPWPDAYNGSGWTGAMLTLQKQESAFWYRQAAANRRISIIDTFADTSDLNLLNEGGPTALYASEGGTYVHPNHEGARFWGVAIGTTIASVLPLSGRKRALGRYDQNAGNLLTNARFNGGAAGTVAGVFPAAGKNCPTGFSVATATRRGGTVDGGHCQLVNDRLRPRVNGMQVAAGDLIDTGDAYLYLVRNIDTGVLAGAAPANYAGNLATTPLFDFANAFADGGANLFRIPRPKFDATRPSLWLYIDPRATANSGSQYVDFFQTVALPAWLTPLVDYVQGELEVIQLGGTYRSYGAMLTAYNGATELSRASESLPSIWPTAAKALTLEPEWCPTPALMVPPNCTHLDLALRLYFDVAAGAVGCPVLARLPLMEKAPAPGTIG